MASKKCAKCDKTVYPAEELKCLDKSWHKGCFRCTECNMALTMKNYKGFNKLPYCNAHYPQLSATVVADTPENRRIAQNSNMQSQVAYQADFIQNIRGTVTNVAEDNEMKRARDVGNVVSQASYARQSRGSQGAPDDYRTNSTLGQASSARQSHVSQGVPDDFSTNSTSEPNYTRPMREYTEESGYPATPTNYMAAQPQPPPANVVRPAAPPPAPSGPMYQAMYDYDAQDDDEVTFVENDRIVNCEVVDEGWVIGTVERTGQRGMIPANYIEQM